MTTYIPRPKLEKSLFDAVDGGMHVVVCGESGSGKSWLYKKVFKDKKISYRVINCASTERQGSITNTIWSSVIPDGHKSKTAIKEGKKAEANAYFAKGSLESFNEYKVSQEDPLLEAFKYLRKTASSEMAILVLDNLEFIFSSDSLMRELGSIIMLLDDETFSSYKIQLLIVGVPSGILDYFSRAENLESIANRLEEVDKVPPLTAPMVQTLCKVGFNDALKMNLNDDDIKMISVHTHHITLGLAQRVQEYFLKLAKIIEENNNTFIPDLLGRANLEWLKGSFRKCYSVVESFLVNGKNGTDRRNQVIFCIGKIRSHEFDADDIDASIRLLFSETLKNQKVNFYQIFKDLSSGEIPLIKKSSAKGKYVISDSKYLMTIRAMLYIHPTTKMVEKKKFTLG